MFKKNKKQTETIKEPKEKKVRTVKVGTHKKTVIALWVVLIASVSFGVYKNFTAIDQHTTHEKEIIELRLQDTNGIENFVKNFAKSYYTWNNSKEAIESRTQAINGYLTKELQDLNVDTIRTDIPTSSTVTDVIVWHIEQSGTDTFSATYEVDQQIKEGEKTSNAMENKKKMKQLHAVLLITGIPLNIIQWVSIILWITTGIQWLFWGYILVAIPYAIFIIRFLSKRIVYICPQCHEIFKPHLKEFIFSNHSMTLRKLTCTSCGYHGFCVETYREEEKNNE